ncbi:uncharacterized protein LOC127130940 [Lathyrus oleraceus]|uniref:uncharacterized protein LOC127130940 n=1 Tax=Pisum sativum TaxID=3888 RepID=UPI0021CF9777|nr:uncharacterized protein LOC127130940 [Pisum sativum]
MRKAKTSSSRKNHIRIEPNVGMNEDGFVATNVADNAKAYGTVNKPISITALSKSSMIVTDRDGIDKNIRVLISQVLGIEPKTNVVSNSSTSLAQPDNNTENPINNPDIKNLIDQPIDIVNIEDLDSDDVPIGKRLAYGIAKRLKNRKGQVVGSSNAPSKSVIKKANVGPTKRWSKVVTPTPKKKSLKRKKVPSESSESDQDVEHNVQDIISNIPEVPLDNISFHSVENVEKWNYVYQRRLALERKLRKDEFECKKVLSLIQEVGLIKTIIGFRKCYEMLVKEFIVNIFEECDNKRRKEFRKVYVRGRCVDFSSEIINRFLGRNGEEQAEIKVSDDVVYKEITAKQVKEWPRKGKLSVSDLSLKYVVLHIIGVANWVPTNHTSNIAIGLGKFMYIVGTKSNFDFGSYVFYHTMKHVASYVVKLPIAFPSLICGVILSQHPNILINSDSTCKRDPPLSLHYRLFTRKHVLDIVMTSGHTSSRSTNRTSILTKLKDTCKTLDKTIKSCTKRKGKLEMLIKALSEEKGGEKTDRTDEEEDNEDIIVTSDEEETSNV